MKMILEFIVNIFIYILYFYHNLLLMLWYGKLPKVSAYHQWKGGDYNPKDVFNDKLIQSRNNPAHKRAKDFLNYLADNRKNIDVINLDVSIYDGQKKIGTQTLYSYLLDELKRFESEEENL